MDIQNFKNLVNDYDLRIFTHGFSHCEPGHYWGPGLRNCYLLHYVVEGTGIFSIDSLEYSITPGHCFYITPTATAYYRADMDKPWTYWWFGFNGTKACDLLAPSGLSTKNPIFFLGEQGDFFINCVKRITHSKYLKSGKEAFLTSLIYQFVSGLLEAAAGNQEHRKTYSSSEEYALKTAEYIDNHLDVKIKISDISKYLNISNDYLCSIFKGFTGMSIQTYLLHEKINRACKLLTGTTLSIAETAWSVGYEDPLLFSRMFRRVKGVCPREYRKACQKG